MADCTELEESVAHEEHEIVDVVAEVEVRDPPMNSDRNSPENHWNVDIVQNIARFLMDQTYPGELTKDQRRNFRKRAKDFVVEEDRLFISRVELVGWH